jgi:hypothetical protein
LDFHSRCDNKGPTFTLYKIKDGYCIGGFTKASWLSLNNYYIDSDAMLFNLSKGRHFPNKKSGKEIGCDKVKGP